MTFYLNSYFFFVFSLVRNFLVKGLEYLSCTEAEVNPEPKPELETQPKPEPKPELETQPELGTQPKPEPELEPQAEPELEPQPQAEPELESHPELEPQPQTEPGGYKPFDYIYAMYKNSRANKPSITLFWVINLNNLNQNLLEEGRDKLFLKLDSMLLTLPESSRVYIHCYLKGELKKEEGNMKYVNLIKFAEIRNYLLNLDKMLQDYKKIRDTVPKIEKYIIGCQNALLRESNRIFISDNDIKMCNQTEDVQKFVAGLRGQKNIVEIYYKSLTLKTKAKFNTNNTVFTNMSQDNINVILKEEPKNDRI